MSTATPQQNQIEELIRKGRFEAARKALEALVSLNDSTVAEWARMRLTRLQQDLERQRGEIGSIEELSRKLLKKSDYAGAVELLKQIPGELKSPQAASMFAEATEKNKETQLLQKDIEQEIEKQLPDQLPMLVKRFLQLKPGHKAMQALAADLNRYGPERAVRIRQGQQIFRDPAGRSVEPKHVVFAVAGIVLLFAVVYAANLKFQVPRGTVVVEVADAGVVIRFGGEEINRETSSREFPLNTSERLTLEAAVDGVAVPAATQEVGVGENETKRLIAKLRPDRTLEITIQSHTDSFAVPDKLFQYPPKAELAADSPVTSDAMPVAPAAPPPGPPSPPMAKAPFTATEAERHQAAWADFLGKPVEYTNSVGMKFRLIPPGEFVMGSTADDVVLALAALPQVDRQRLARNVESETPQHTVILKSPFYIGTHEVTQQQYEAVTGGNPSHFSASGAGNQIVGQRQTGDFPVEEINWNDAAKFCELLSMREQLPPHYAVEGNAATRLDGSGYRLPTEAEWEFACRAGTTTRYSIGDDGGDLTRTAWIAANSNGMTHPVGDLRANPFGLFDMHGNVWEWVQDRWEPEFYKSSQSSAAIDPAAAIPVQNEGMLRGGEFGIEPARCRSSARNGVLCTYRFRSLGFRVALAVSAVPKRQADSE